MKVLVLVIFIITNSLYAGEFNLIINPPTYTHDSDILAIRVLNDPELNELIKLHKDGAFYKTIIHSNNNELEVQIVKGLTEILPASKDGIKIDSYHLLDSTILNENMIDISQWSDQIGRFNFDLNIYEKQISMNPNYIFVGSSSARLWTTIKDDFPGLEIFSIGAGGAHVEDLILYYNRMIYQYSPKHLILYAGENDLASGESPELTFMQFKDYINLIKSNDPKLQIFCTSIKISPSRIKFKNSIMRYNKMIKESGLCHYINTFSVLLDSEEMFKDDIFKEDNLHLNHNGYKLWAEKIFESISIQETNK